MRRTTLLLLSLIIQITLLAQHDVWTQRAQSGGATPVARYQGVAFSINNKGYVGTGNSDPNGVTLLKDFWEYDPVTDQWTQKADFGGSARRLAVGFAIGTKGYIGTGDDGSVKNDFWEYDPVGNTWSIKANFVGAARNNAVGFAIGTKGYIGTGVDGSANFLNDFYEYDQTSNTWLARAALPAAGRNAAVGFAIGTKGYIGTGFSDPGAVFYNDFWEYDPAGNTWTQKANVGGPGRNAATGVSIANRGYIGMGFGGTFRNDFWEYDPASNTWIQKANMSGGGRNTSTAFNISNDRCYVSSGYLATNAITNDIWEYKAWEPLTPGSNSIIPPIPATLCGSGVPPVLIGSTPAGGDGIYSYQWLSSTDNINFTPIAGANSKDYAPGNISQTTYYKRAIASFYNLTDTSASVSITVYAKPVASFTIDNAALCLSGNLFNFTNTSTISSGTFTSVWNFGDGNTASTTHASHSYTSAGTYVVKLVVTSNNGCKDSVQQNVTVYPQPLSNFTINSTAQCVNGNSFNFTNTSAISSGTFSSAWNFGDGNTASSTDATHSYTNAGSYNVQLITTSNNGCKDSVTQTVTVNPKPTPGFTINDDTQCVNGNSFSFTNTSTISSGTLLYNWYFGDGGTSTSISPTYIYTTAGTYIVKLVVSSTVGCKDSISQTITVFPKPTPAFSINNASQCLSGNSFVFTNGSSISSGTFTSVWNFGDGYTATTTNATHTYSNTGTYTVTLVITSDNGCKDSISNTVTVSAPPSGTITAPNGTFICGSSTALLQVTGGSSYQWYLNNNPISGATGSSYYADQTGTYTVQIFSNSGCSAYASNSINITILPNPVAAFNWNSSCLNTLVQFNNLSTVPSGTPLYTWTFGTVGTSNNANPSFIFTQTGTYAVKLKVQMQGCSSGDSITKNITISAAVPGVKLPPMDIIKNQPTQITGRNFVNYQYNWIPSTSLSSSSIYNPVATLSQQQQYLIRMVSEISGCVTTDTLLVRIFDEPDIWVPKAFTPNGDGKNDVLRPILVQIREFKFFRVYNRWGNLVFESRLPDVGWRGTYKDKDQPTETYTWVAEGIDINGRTIRRTGATTLIR
jgi:gliding motility-associated-like protein